MSEAQETKFTMDGLDLGGITGPFYGVAELRSWLGLTEEEIQRRSEEGEILSCQTKDGFLIFPVWQFKSDGTLHDGIYKILRNLWKGTRDGWTIALWMSSESETFGGSSARSLIANNEDYSEALRASERDAAIWSGR